MALFDIQGLTFTYPGAERPALAEVSLQVEAGSFLCICGQSASGKTTLLRQLKTALTPVGERQGRVRFNGVDLEDVSLREQSAAIGFVMQDPEAQVVMDEVRDELAFGLENVGCPPSLMRVRMAEAVSAFGLEGWLHRPVDELSGGQKQVLNLASAVALDPRALILDEPTAQLDPVAASRFLSLVRMLNREWGLTVIMTEHHLEEAYASADVVVALKEGRICAMGEPRAVGLELAQAQDGLACALPTPLRIALQVEGATGMEKVDAASLPLTVREGRAWLQERVRGRLLEDRVRVQEGSAAMGASRAQGAGDAVLRMKDVWFRYGKDEPCVLRGVDLAVPRGSRFAIMGGNGSGKSTLLKVACGICKPERGGASLFGKPLRARKGSDPLQRGAALLPQAPQDLFAHATVRADLAEMLPDAAGDELFERIEEVARTCGIQALLDRHPLDLSSGELQRSALAKVLLARPQLLLADEPAKGLDAFAERALADVLQGLSARGVTLLMVSHDVELTARIATHVALLFDGELTDVVDPQELFANGTFYATPANRMSRSVMADAVTDEEVVRGCLGG